MIKRSMAFAFDQDSSLTVNLGRDNVTGLGTPNTTWLTTG